MNSLTLDAMFVSEYDKLKRIAEAKLFNEPGDISITATVLVHETYLKLRNVPSFEDKDHLLRAAAVAMQRVLIDHARKKNAQKRPSSLVRISLDQLSVKDGTQTDTWITVQEGLDKLDAEDKRCAAVAKLRLLSGLSIAESAEVLSTSRAQAYREWAYAKAWLTDFLSKRIEP
jgi:RNA polymerase sigma factor (TIGR02999 family)